MFADACQSPLVRRGLKPCLARASSLTLSPPRGGVIETEQKSNETSRPGRLVEAWIETDVPDAVDQIGCSRLLVEAWIETTMSRSRTQFLCRLLVEAWIETV